MLHHLAFVCDLPAYLTIFAMMIQSILLSSRLDTYLVFRNHINNANAYAPSHENHLGIKNKVIRQVSNKHINYYWGDVMASHNSLTVGSTTRFFYDLV